MRSHSEVLLSQGKKCRVLYTTNSKWLCVYALVFLFSGCSAFSQKKVGLYVVNNEETEKNVELKIYIDDSLCVNQTFRYSNVVPNYELHSFEFRKGIHKIKVLKEDKEMISDTFNLKKGIFIYISYGKENGSEEKIYLMKTTKNHVQH
jgi:hypothetical protein